MKFTVITVCFNSEKTIEQTVKSVLSQTYENVEYIIVDGKSIDTSLEILSKYKCSIDYLISEPDRGIYDALNKGVMISTGDIIGFLHSDDTFASPNTLADILDTFIETEADVVYGNLEYVSNDIENKVIRFWESSSFTLNMLKKGWMPPHPTVFMKKVVYEKHGLFNLNYKISADYDYMLRVFKDRSLNFQYLPKLITKMKTGGLSNRGLKNIIKKSVEDYHIINNHGLENVLKVLLLKNVSKIKQFYIS